MNTLQIKARSVVARLGIMGIVFFTLKGCMWLLIPVLMGWLL